MLEPLVAPDASPGKPASPNPPPPQPAAAHRHERPRGQVLEAVLAVAAGLFDCRCAMLWTMDAGRLRLAAARGLPAGVDGPEGDLMIELDYDSAGELPTPYIWVFQDGAWSDRTELLGTPYLVDFAAGLIFGLRGNIERVSSQVFLLCPANLVVGPEDKERLVSGGFFNQS